MFPSGGNLDVRYSVDVGAPRTDHLPFKIQIGTGTLSSSVFNSGVYSTVRIVCNDGACASSIAEWNGLMWDITATNSYVSHSYGSPVARIKPNGRNLQITAEAFNDCGVSSHKVYGHYVVEGYIPPGNPGPPSYPSPGPTLQPTTFW